MGFLMAKNLKSNIMKPKTCYIFMFFFLTISGCGIISKQQPVDKNNDSEIIDFEVDKLGDFYTRDSDGVVVKYHNGTKTSTYSNYNLGELSTIDVTNPHKILLFYKEQQTIVLLDNSLTELGKILFDNKSYFSAIGFANDGNIWLYDSFLSKLKKIDNTGKEIEESFPLSQINPENIIDAKIIDRGNYVIIADKDTGVLLFNNLGFFDKVLPVKDIAKPTIVKNKLYYYNRRENCYISKKIIGFIEEKKLCFDKYKLHPKLVIFENDKFYILENNSIKTYSVGHFGFNPD